MSDFVSFFKEVLSKNLYESSHIEIRIGEKYEEIS